MQLTHLYAAFAALAFVLPIGPTGIAADDGPDRTDLSVMTMLDMVRARGDGTPVDGTSILRRIMEEGIYSPAPRADPPPTSWTLVHTGTYCRAYVGEGGSVQLTSVEALCDTFDSTIYPTATSWFHPDSPPSMIDLKIYDFGDGPGYAAGYFIRSFATRDELYVDSQDITIADEVVAHEFEHLLHYDLDANEEVWLDEGLADLSIRVSLGADKPALQGHIDSYEYEPENDLLDWGDEIPDYGAAYAFIAYLADHYGGISLISDLAKDLRNSVSSVDAQLAAHGHSDRMFQVHARAKAANIADDPAFGGGIYDQGLISIRISTMAGGTGTYPYSATVTGSVRYAGYYYALTSGSSALEASVNSTSSVHATVLGTTTDDQVRWSANLTTSGGVPGRVRLDGFGTLYQKAYVIPSTDVSGASFRVEVRALEVPEASVSVDPASPDGDNGFYRTPPLITLDCPGGSVYYRWGSGAFSPYSEPLTAPEGESALQFYPLKMGITGDTSTREFKVDTIGPVTSISLNPATPDGENGYYITAPRVALVTERNASASYDLGSGERTYDGPFELGTGTYEIMYWSVDEAGNRETTRRETVKVDLEDPVVQMEKYPAAANGQRGYYVDPVTVSFTAPEGTEVFFRIGNGGFEAYGSSFILGDGVHDLEYYAVTLSGKIGATHADRIKVDTIGPEVTYRTEPALEPRWQNTTVELHLTPSEKDARVLLSIGGGSEVEVSGYTVLTEGDYTVSFRCVDEAGNSGGTTTLHARIDTSTPHTLLRFARDPDQGYWYQDELPDITIENQGTTLSPETTYYSVNGGSFRTFDGSMDGLVSGLNGIRFYTMDEAGNTEQVRNRQVGLDLDPPKAAMRANRTLVREAGPVSFDLGRSTDDNIVYQYKVDFGDGTDSGWVRFPQISHDYGALGTYKAKAYVMDASGRTNENAVQVTIEVLTPEEYAKRMEGSPPWALIAILIVVVIFALIAVAALMAILIRRRSQDGPGIADAEIMDWDS